MEYVSGALPDVYVDKLLTFVAGQLESSRHLQFYLTWTQRLLYRHGAGLKQRAPHVLATLRSLQKAMTRKYEDLAKMYVSFRSQCTYVLGIRLFSIFEYILGYGLQTIHAT